MSERTWAHGGGSDGDIPRLQEHAWDLDVLRWPRLDDPRGPSWRSGTPVALYPVRGDDGPAVRLGSTPEWERDIIELTRPAEAARATLAEQAVIFWHHHWHRLAYIAVVGSAAMIARMLWG